MEIDVNYWKPFIIEAHNSKCSYCGKKSDELHIDHIIPKRKEVINTLDNLIPADNHCNVRLKNGKIYEENHIIILQEFAKSKISKIKSLEKEWREKQNKILKKPKGEPDYINKIYSKDENNCEENDDGVRISTCVDLPSGQYPRMILGYITTFCIKNKSNKISFPKITDFISNYLYTSSSGGDQGCIKRVKTQFKLLLFSDIFKKTSYYIDFNKFDNSYINLDKELYDDLITNCIPLEVDTIKKIKKSPISMDIYYSLYEKIINDGRGDYCKTELEKKINHNFNSANNDGGKKGIYTFITKSIKDINKANNSDDCFINSYGKIILSLDQAPHNIAMRVWNKKFNDIFFYPKKNLSFSLKSG